MRDTAARQAENLAQRVRSEMNVVRENVLLTLNKECEEAKRIAGIRASEYARSVYPQISGGR